MWDSVYPAASFVSFLKKKYIYMQDFLSTSVCNSYNLVATVFKSEMFI